MRVCWTSSSVMERMLTSNLPPSAPSLTLDRKSVWEPCIVSKYVLNFFQFSPRSSGSSENTYTRMAQVKRRDQSHKHAQSHTSHTRDADTCTDCSCLEALDRTVLRSKNALTIAAALASTFSPTYLMSASCR